MYLDVVVLSSLLMQENIARGLWSRLLEHVPV